MTSSVQPLAQVQLGTALGLIYAAPLQPPQTRVKFTMCSICNTDSVIRTFTLRKGVPPLTAANSIFENSNIDGNKTYFLTEGQGIAMVLAAGQELHGLASIAGKITVTVDGEIIY